MNEKIWRLRTKIKTKFKIKFGVRFRIKFDAWVENSFHFIDVNFWWWSEISEQEIFEKVDTNDWEFNYVYLMS